MALSLKHLFTSTKAEGGNSSKVRTSNWNAEHLITMATNKLLGRGTAGTGAVEEITLGTGLELSGTTLNGTATTDLTAVDLGYYNVKAYGAVGDGVTDDTGAIQDAIDDAQNASGGIVYFPPGEYKIQPPAISTGWCLFISKSRVHIMGAGRFVTKLTFYLYDGSDPETHWPIYAGAVLRGRAFRISDSIQTITSFKISGLEIDGQCDTTSDHGPPANTSDGDGWDTTHQCITVEPGAIVNDLVIEDCYFHSWRGEIIWSNQGVVNLVIRRCKLTDCNGSTISSSATSSIIEECEIADGYQGIENAFDDGMHVIRGNYIHDMENGGMHVYPCFEETIGFAEIYNNTFRTVYKSLLAPGARNMRIYNNLFVDCLDDAITAVSPGGGGSGDQEITVHNLEIFNNTFVKDDESGTMRGVDISLNAEGFFQSRYVSVHDNTSVRSQRAYDTGVSMPMGPPISSNTALLGEGCRWENNNHLGGGGDDQTFSVKPFSTILTSGAEQVFGKIWHDSRDRLAFRVYLTYYVLASCTLRFRVTYYKPGSSGTLISEDILASGAKVEDDKGSFFVERLASYDPDGRITVYYTCDTANAVHAHLDMKVF